MGGRIAQGGRRATRRVPNMWASLAPEITVRFVESRLEDRGPVVFYADHRPAIRGRVLKRLLGAGGVGEFPRGVVVQDEQAQERLVGMPAELEHGDVAVGVAGGQQWPATDPAPDADRLLRAVVEVVGFRRVRD